MNYRFESSYTHAESVKWEVQAMGLLNESQSPMSLASAVVVVVVQFLLWTPIFYFLYVMSVPFLLMAPLLFIAFIAISIFYDSVILPHVTALFDKEARETKTAKYQSIIKVDEEAVRSYTEEQDITFKWDTIRDIHDSPSSVIFLTKRGYCLIPARCFDGFLAKDAFVRDCIERLRGKTEQGAYFT